MRIKVKSKPQATWKTFDRSKLQPISTGFVCSMRVWCSSSPRAPFCPWPQASACPFARQTAAWVGDRLKESTLSFPTVPRKIRIKKYKLPVRTQCRSQSPRSLWPEQRHGHWEQDRHSGTYHYRACAYYLKKNVNKIMAFQYVPFNAVEYLKTYSLLKKTTKINSITSQVNLNNGWQKRRCRKNDERHRKVNYP